MFSLKEKMMSGHIMIVGIKDLNKLQKNWIGAFLSDSAFFWKIKIGREHKNLFMKYQQEKLSFDSTSSQ